MINLPNGETWTNGEDNSSAAIAWVRSMFADALDNNIPIGDHQARGFKLKKDSCGEWHCCILTIKLDTNLKIDTPLIYTQTTDYIISEI